MENHKGMMKEFLSESLRQLMLRSVFEKITIKQICVRAGVIRATFYNYFDDKYDCLNTIVYRDIAEVMMEDYNAGKLTHMIGHVLDNVEENRDFYKTAYNVIGQNSFEDMVRSNLKTVMLDILEQNRTKGNLDQYDNDLLAGYYAECIAYQIKCFVYRKDESITPEEMERIIVDLMRYSLLDFLPEAKPVILQEE